MNKKKGLLATIIIILAVVAVIYIRFGSVYLPIEFGDRCLMKPDACLCKSAIPRYYFDNEEGICKEFLWGGCAGSVPFETLDRCRSHCEPPVQEGHLNYFIERMQHETNEHYGKTLTEYEPYMFLDAMPGLVAQDFDGVQSVVGSYEAVEDNVVYNPWPSSNVWDYNKPISEEGMGTLLNNMAMRLGISIKNRKSIDDILLIILVLKN